MNLLLKATVFKNPTSVEMKTTAKEERVREQWSWRVLFIILIFYPIGSVMGKGKSQDAQVWFGISP